MKKWLTVLSLCAALTLSSCSTPTTSNSVPLFSSGGTSQNQSSTGNNSSSSGGNSSSSGTSSDCAHKDLDVNDVCDSCFAPVAVTFDIFNINDLHGKFADTDSQPGVDELTTYFKQAKAANPNTILLSTGDMWQGAPESNLTKGLIVTDWMNELDFTCMTLGNHEYDWGETYIEENAQAAEFPLLAINIYDAATNQLVDYCQPSVMVEKSGVKIGIIGAIGDCYSSISSDKVQDVYFKTGSQLTSLVKTESTRLKNQGADFIIYTIHDGYGSSLQSETSVSDNQIASYYDISLSKGYVDLVFEGHSHQRYVLKDSAGVYHMQGGGDNDGISHVQVKINPVADKTNVQSARFLSTNVYTHLQDDAVVGDLLDKYEEQIAIAGRVVGTNDAYRSSDYLCQCVADCYVAAGVERWGEDYDIVLGGGFITARSPYSLSAGQVLYGDLQSIFPFDNPIVLCSISGYYLKQRFINTDDSRYYIAFSEYGASIKNSIVDNQTYYIVLDTYSSSYTYNYATEILRYDETTYARDLLADFIENGGLSQRTLTSIPTILSIGYALSNGAMTSNSYYVQGTITNIYNTTYGNMTIEDEQGNTLYIYGVNDTNGNRYDAMSNKPQVGDTVLLNGPIQKYVMGNSVTIELFHSTLIQIISTAE